MLTALSSLERAVLDVIALQVPEVANALAGQWEKVHVTARENTGAGFYTKFDVPQGSPIERAAPLGDVGASVDGLEHGMGFLLWLQDGHIHQLEGYSYEENTSDIDFERVVFGAVGPRAMTTTTLIRDHIYIPLIDEGTEVIRPTFGVSLGSGTYRVLATPAYDPDDEHWKFPPGSVVRCTREMREGSEVLLAQELACDTG